MKDSNLVSIPIDIQLKLSNLLSPISDEERVVMSNVPYASVVVKLMFSLICIRSDLGHVISLISRFMLNLGKGHWFVVK